jgi:hypothetical protein
MRRCGVASQPAPLALQLIPALTVSNQLAFSLMWVNRNTRQSLRLSGGKIMAAKVTLLNRLKAALSPEGDETDEIQSALRAWRAKALSVLLIVIAGQHHHMLCRSQRA